jgi:hypothetical protein
MGKGGWQGLAGIRIALGFFVVLIAAARVNAQPVNDNVANAIRLVGDHVLASGSNARATRETAEPTLEERGGASVWWAWKASAAGMVTVSTEGSDFDTMAAIFSIDGTGKLTKLAFDDDVQGEDTSLARAYVLKGAEYRILIDGFHGATGRISLTLDIDATVTPINNDHYADAVSLDDPGSVRALNYLATSEAGELRPLVEANRSVWWVFQASADLPVTVSTVGSDFDTVVAVYDDDRQLVAWDDDAIGSNEIVRFNARVGRTYRIGVYGYDEESGLIALQIHSEIPLSARREGDEFVLRWPAVFAGYSLEGASLVSPFSWGSVTNAASTVGGQNEVRMGLQTPPRAFRLKHP